MGDNIVIDDWLNNRAWQFIISQGHSDKFYKWSEKYTKDHGDYLMEGLADMYIDARPKLKAMYIASLVVRRMEK